MRYLIYGGLLFLLGCLTEEEWLIKNWKHEYTNIFIEEGKKAGCFDIKKLPDGTSCYSTVFFQGKIWCEKLCPREAPKCYEFGDEIIPERCIELEKWHKEHDKKTNHN